MEGKYAVLHCADSRTTNSSFGGAKIKDWHLGCLLAIRQDWNWQTWPRMACFVKGMYGGIHGRFTELWRSRRSLRFELWNQTLFIVYQDPRGFFHTGIRLPSRDSGVYSIWVAADYNWPSRESFCIGVKIAGWGWENYKIESTAW